MPEPIEIALTLRDRNQLTLPDRIAARLGVSAGDRILVTLEEGGGIATLRPLPRSYAGALGGDYGRTQEDAAAYIAEERGSWERVAPEAGQASDGTPYLSYEESKRVYWQTEVTRERYAREPKLRWPECEICGRSIARMAEHLAAHRAGQIDAHGVATDPGQVERSRRRIVKWRRVMSSKVRRIGKQR